MTHKIAVIKTREFENYSDYDNYSMQKIVESITEWEEVSDEDFKALQFALPRIGCTIIERPMNEPAFIAKTLADYKAFAKAEEAKAAEEKRKREEAALERKFKKELKDKASKEKMLAKLAKELGVEVAGLPEEVTAK